MDMYKYNADYVDNPYWSIFQIKVRKLLQEQEQVKTLGEGGDLGKVNILGL